MHVTNRCAEKIQNDQDFIGNLACEELDVCVKKENGIGDGKENLTLCSVCQELFHCCCIN